jgi:hypothetical protein
MSFRIHGFPSDVVEPIWLFPDDSALKAHSAYSGAKAGEVAESVELVSDLAFPFLNISNPATAMKSNKSSVSTPPPSPPTKPTTSLVFARLTRSEIDSLRQGKKQISAYAQKALQDRVSTALGQSQ